MAAPILVDDRVAERFALVAGLVLATAALATIGVLAYVDPPLAVDMIVQVSTHALVGRETGVPVGLERGLPMGVVGVLAATQDLCILLIGYPLAAMVGRGALKVPFLDRFAHKPHPKRDEFARRTQAAGVTLLALMLWVPFFPGGALLASLLSRAAGYHPRLFLPVLAASTLAADAFYTLLIGFVGERVGYGTIAFVALGIVLATGVVTLLVRFLRRRGVD